jgi:hypothetical protein
MTRKIVKIFAIFLIILAAIVAVFFWRIGSNGSCFMYGTVYTPIKTIDIDNKKYHLYRSISGIQDKAYIISLSPVELPETICDYSAIKTPIYSTDFDQNKTVEKLLITKKNDGELYLEPVYSTAEKNKEHQDFSDLKIEFAKP